VATERHRLADLLGGLSIVADQGFGLRSLRLGKSWRSRPLVFSFELRCQRLRGSQKHTGTPAASAAPPPMSSPTDQLVD